MSTPYSQDQPNYSSVQRIYAAVQQQNQRNNVNTPQNPYAAQGPTAVEQQPPQVPQSYIVAGGPGGGYQYPIPNQYPAPNPPPQQPYQTIETPFPANIPPPVPANPPESESFIQRKSSLASLKGAKRGMTRNGTLANFGRGASVASRMETVKRKPITLVATAGRDAAIERCREKVEQIARECKEKNLRFRDTHFDVDNQNCLYALDTADDILYRTAGTKRVWEIFDDPKFFENGTTAGDIQQGAAGDCYFLAALATVTNVPTLISQLCVARDESVGVYGFIFFRDGDWTSVVVDDLLYTRAADYSNADPVLRTLLRHDEQLYRTLFQSGSDALFFSACKDKNETWLPLLEKAYAKLHGDYESIDGGLTGEAVEDLTGGVTTTLYCKDILDVNRFWREELMLVNEQYLFAVGIVEKKRPPPPPTPSDAGPGASPSNPEGEKVSHNGLVPGHAYSVLKAVEKNGKRFVLIRNPWGKTEWNGKWSDGSAEWTPEWMIALGHRFGNDGLFWMEYPDFLRQWTLIDRTRLFDSSYTVASQWIRLPAFWPAEWSSTVFTLTINQSTPATIVLSQLDSRYFRGLQGLYDFYLEIRVTDARTGTFIARSRGLMHMRRSTNVEIRQLEEGTYIVHVKVTRIRIPGRKEVVDAVVQGVQTRADKVLSISENYIMARAKAGCGSEGVFRALGLTGHANMDGAAVGRPAPQPQPEQEEQQEGGDGAQMQEGNPQLHAVSFGAGEGEEEHDPTADIGPNPDDEEEEAGQYAEEELAQPQDIGMPQNALPDEDSETPTVVVGLRVYALDPDLHIAAHVGGEIELHVGVDPEDAHGDEKQYNEELIGIGGNGGGHVGFAGARGQGVAKPFGGFHGKDFLGAKHAAGVEKRQAKPATWTKSIASASYVARRFK